MYKKLLLTLKNHDLHVDILIYNVQWSFNSFLFCFFCLFFVLLVFFKIENECEYVRGLGSD